MMPKKVVVIYKDKNRDKVMRHYAYCVNCRAISEFAEELASVELWAEDHLDKCAKHLPDMVERY
jgi:hypothetical protein